MEGVHLDMVKTSLALPRALWRDAHVLAMDQGRDLKDVIADALRSYIAAARKEGRR